MTIIEEEVTKNISDGEVTESEVNADYWFNTNEANVSEIKNISSINRTSAPSVTNILNLQKSKSVITSTR